MEHLEHRWGVRARLDIPVQVDCSSGVVVLGVMRDASVSGAFISTAVPLPAMTAVKLVLVSKRSGARRGRIDAFVVRRDEEGYGLEWCDLAPRAIIKLLAPHEAKPMAVARRSKRAIAIPPEIRPAQLLEREDLAV